MRRATLALLCVAQFAVVLDVSIVAIALPTIGADLGIGSGDLQWIISAYTLAFGGFLVPAGRAADIYGRRALFMTGLGLFATASLACALAEAPAVLIGARAVQGLGAALLAPAALALVSATFPDPSERARAVAIWTAAAAAGGASGWVLGGVLAEALGWEAVFLVNLPVGAAGVALAPRLVAESRAPRTARRSLDVAGAATVTAGLTLLIYGLTRIERAGPASPQAVGALALAALCLVAWLRVERRAPNPLVPLAVLRSRPLAGANLAALALTATTTPAMFLCILYLQDVLERAPTEAGLALVPFNLAVIAGSALAPRLRLGQRDTMAAGLAGIAAGSLLLLTLSPGGGAGLVPAELLMGAALGAAAVASTASGTAAVDAEAQGLVSGILNAAAQVGTAIGLAVLITLVSARTGVDPSDAALIDGYRWGFAGAALLAVAAAAVVLRLTPTPPACAARPHPAP